MVDKIKIYTKDKDICMWIEKINNIDCLLLKYGDKLELIIKQLIDKENNLNIDKGLIYYNSSMNLEEYLYSDPYDDICKKDLTMVVTLKNNIQDNNLETILQKFSAYVIEYINTNLNDRKEFLKKNLVNIGTGKYAEYASSSKEATLKTHLGDLTIKKNDSNFPAGYLIELNNVPIVLIEETTDKHGEHKLVIKRYPNSKVIHDDGYMNLKSYGIDEKLLSADLIKSIIESLD